MGLTRTSSISAMYLARMLARELRVAELEPGERRRCLADKWLGVVCLSFGSGLDDSSKHDASLMLKRLSIERDLEMWVSKFKKLKLENRCFNLIRVLGKKLFSKLVLH